MNENIKNVVEVDLNEIEMGGETFTLPETDEAKWLIVEEETYKHDHKEFIVNLFNKDYPKFNITEYDTLVKLCSTNDYFTDWLNKANLKYSETAQLPKYLSGTLRGDAYKQVQANLTKTKSIRSEIAIKKQNLVNKYKKEISDLEKSEDERINKIIGEDKILFVLSLSRKFLPFSIQIAINNYVPSDGSKKEKLQRTRYARECLIRYKKALIELIVADPDVEIRKLVKDNLIK